MKGGSWYNNHSLSVMFSEFENMFKAGGEKPSFSSIISQDYSKTPQKYNINGREIAEKKLLAEGAFGFIWLAEDTNTKQQFALKRVICMTPEGLKSALTQKTIMEKLPHSPHIVKYEGGLTVKQNSRTVVVTLMELCPGGNMFDLLEKREGKGIPEETVKNIAESVLKGLVVLHKEGIIHRDIKIENIIVGKDKKLKICDFGSCTSAVVDFSAIPQADYDSVKEGIESFTTPMYRPPEVVDPYLKYQVTTKADLWMLGCTLYTMCYFVHPFVDSNAVGISGGVFRFPEYPDETAYKVSDKMKDFIRNLLTPNPSFRPTAAKMLEILAKWDELQTIPLNQDAKRLKKEHEEKREQMKKLNRKAVDYDGDIPIHELMKIQDKLKNQVKEPHEKEQVSFITKKDKKPNQAQPKNQPALKQVGSMQSAHEATKQKKVTKQSSSIDDIWGDTFSKPASNPTNQASGGFNAFNDIFGESKPIVINSNRNLADFHEFFTSPPDASKMASQTKQQTNLLDL